MYSPLHSSIAVLAQSVSVPSAALIPAATLTLGNADSNSPAVWERATGQSRLHVFTSVSGTSTHHAGSQLSTLLSLGGLSIQGPGHGIWLEAIIPDVDDIWYGFYHHERPATVCGEEETRALPRIGAVRSNDLGVTWEDLGIILEAPTGWHDCSSANKYFVGGVGDFSVTLDRDHRYLYFFFSQYVDREQTQGVAVGRIPWADRDEPRGRMSVWWHGDTWIPPRRLRSDVQMARYAYAVGVPIYPVEDGWHDGSSVNAFWGPSVHWNNYLEQYVMLLNRAQDTSWRQEGIYVAFSPTLDNPASWSAPRRLIAGGQWYPQVIGTDIGVGTDREAGQRARFFMSGRSQYLIQFTR
jgi:hypothetical protein